MLKLYIHILPLPGSECTAHAPTAQDSVKASFLPFVDHEQSHGLQWTVPLLPLRDRKPLVDLQEPLAQFRG